MNNENNFITYVNQIEKVCDICMTAQNMTNFDTSIATNFVKYLDEYLTQSSCKEFNKVNDNKQKKGGRPRIYTEILDCSKEIDLLLRCPEVIDITQMKNLEKLKQKKIESIINHEKNGI